MDMNAIKQAFISCHEAPKDDFCQWKERVLFVLKSR